MVSKTMLAASALLFATSSYAAAAMKQMESVNTAALAARGWSVARTLAAHESITLQIGLTLQNTDKMIETLLDRANRKSKNYGKWLDRDEVNAIVGPSRQSREAVLEWLKSDGVTTVSNNDMGVNFKTTVDTANRLLNADFQGYQKEGVVKIRTVEYSVPQDLVDHIDIIHPTTFFGKTEAFIPVHRRYNQIPDAPEEPRVEKRQKPGGKQPTVAKECESEITPSCLKQLYNIGNYTPLATSGSRLGFGSFLNQTASFSDLRLFNDFFKIPQQNFTKVEVTKGAATPETPDIGEANLDVQNLVGVGNPLPITEFLTGGSPPFIPDLEMNDTSKNTNEPYVPYYEFLLSKKNSELPQSISNSYGEPEQTVPKKYAERTCTLIAMMGLRGITVMESSGDTGIGAACLSNDGQKRRRFDPQFPGTCPWITAIGGTQKANPEEAWKDSSGGFSDYFPRPAYQGKTLDEYFSKNAVPAVTSDYSPYYNNKGRGFPDISAHSLVPNFVIFDAGNKTQSGGTSASAPVMAAIFGLINDARLRKGLPTLGFVNPWLYDYGKDFIIDIAAGAARGCDGNNYQTGKKLEGAGIIPNAFWNATIGWDPVTGHGIPDFQKMLASALKKENE